MPLLKGVGFDLAYYTTSSLPQPLWPNFSVFKEVTALNTNLLAQAITSFQNDLIKNGKHGALAVCPPMVLRATLVMPMLSASFFVPLCVRVSTILIVQLRVSAVEIASWDLDVMGYVEPIIETTHTSSIGLTLCSILNPQHLPPQHVTYIQPYHILHLLLQAETSFHGTDARWKKNMEGRSVTGHRLATLGITPGEK